MNMVMEFFNILFLMPISGQTDNIFLAANRFDFEDSTTSASRTFNGRNSDMAFFPAPRTRKLRLP